MRLIDADYAKTLFDGDHPTSVTMRRIFDALPTIDPDVPVKRGRWELQMGGPYSDIRMYHCSECGFELPSNPKKMPAFCEDCGALMED